MSRDIQRLASYRFSDENIFYEMIIDDEGDKWVYFWGTWEGTVAKTNESLVFPVHLACNLVDNKIVEEYTYYNYAPVVVAFNAQDAARQAAAESEN